MIWHSIGQARWQSLKRPLTRVSKWWGSIRTAPSAEALRQNELRWHALLEKTPVAISIARGELITFANGRYVKMFGLQRPEEIVGQPLSRQFAPQCREGIADWARRHAGGQPVPDEQESIAQRVDGTQLRVHLTCTPMAFADGPATVFFLTDISERRTVEQELQRHMEDLTALNTVASVINQSTSTGVLLQSALGQVLSVLHIRTGSIYLLEPGSTLLNLKAQSGISGGTDDETRPLQVEGSELLGIIQSGRPAILEGTIGQSWARALDLREIPSSIVVVPLRAKEETIGVLSLFGCGPRTLGPQGLQFLTALGHQIGAAVHNAHLAENAAEVQMLRGLDKLRSELIANVSHELRTPLGLIKLFCTNLMRQDVHFPESEQQEFLAEIDKETTRLQSIVDNLLDLSRIQNGQIYLDKRQTDLTELIGGIVAGAQAQSKSHCFVQQLPALPLQAVVDAKRIEQVLRNLVTNAIKYSPAGGAITIRASVASGRIMIHVSDQGIGIPQTEWERVFDRFYRVDNAITRRVGGAGLGLSICKRIVEAHGGAIWGESVPDSGSTFSFSLPLEDDGDRAHPLS